MSITELLTERFGETIQEIMDENDIDHEDLWETEEGKEILSWIKQLPINFEVE